MKKKLLAGLLTAALLVSLLTFPASAAFSDVTDPDVARAVGILQQLGVVNGMGDGTFAPDSTYTRAQFCKMAIVVLGREQETQYHAGRVIFTDVTARHWALRYINTAAAADNGAAPLVQGRGNGLFGPDDPITYGEAVTILMRALGYTDQEVRAPGPWYAGHLLRAQSIGLLNGLDLGGDATLTRGQAALLFENLLFTPLKGSDALFLTAVLGGSVTQPQIVVSVEEVLPAGGWAVQTSTGRFSTQDPHVADRCLGAMSTLVLDKDGSVLAVRPAEGYTTRSVRVLSAESRFLTAEGGEQLIVSSSTPVYTPGSASAMDYGSCYTGLPYGSTVYLCWDRAGNLLFLYHAKGAVSRNGVTAVCTDAAHPFADILPTGVITVYKSGVPADFSDIKLYDVGVYDDATGTLRVFDRKLTGLYSNAAPSPNSPDTITVLGVSFHVLDCALKDLQSFRLGDLVTLLLDGESNVAGVLSPDKLTAQTLGVADIAYSPAGSSADVTLTLTRDGQPIQVAGTVSASAREAEQAPGRLVAVTGQADGALRLTYPDSAAVPGAWDLSRSTLGGLAVSPFAALYDKTPGGPLVPIDRSQITLDVVPADRIAFLHTDNAGIVDAIVLNDVTGDAYTYGILTGLSSESSGDGELTAYNTAVTVSNGVRSTMVLTTAFTDKDVGAFLGVAPSLSAIGSCSKLSASRSLTAISNVRRSAFGEGTVTVSRVEYPLADNIDACCYNAAAKTWFPSLDAALAYSSQLTLYYDKAPSEGGKVRLVVAE